MRMRFFLLYIVIRKCDNIGYSSLRNLTNHLAVHDQFASGIEFNLRVMRLKNPWKFDTNDGRNKNRRKEKKIEWCGGKKER